MSRDRSRLRKYAFHFGVLASACGGSDDSATPAPPPPVECACTPRAAAVSILPPVIRVPSGTTFDLEARILANNGSVIPESFGYWPSWQSQDRDRLQVTARSGHSVTLRALAPGEVELTVEVESDISNKVQILVTDEIAAGEHYVTGLPHDRGSLAVAWVRSATTPNPIFAFAHQASIRAVIPPDEMFVFSPMFQPARGSVQTPLSIALTATNKPPIRIPLEVTYPADWRPGDWGALTTEGIINVEVADANRTYHKNRTGIQLDLSVLIPYYSDEYQPHSCSEIPVRAEGDKLKVYLIAELANLRVAEACPSPRFGILISLPWWGAPSLLAHEIGHVLGLALDTDFAPEFTRFPNNVMKRFDYLKPDARSHLTIGQAFRMNFDATSWLIAPGYRVGSESRTCVDEGGTCPPLWMDF